MAKRGNGEGSIYYSEKLDRWVGQFTAGRKADGKINRKSVYGKTRKEVKEKITKALADVQMQTYVEKNDVEVYNLGAEILNNKFSANIIGENSYGLMNYCLDKIKNSSIGNMKVQKVTSIDIQSFLSTITSLSNSYIEKIIIQLNAIFREAQKREYIYKNPMNNILKPVSIKKDKKVDAFSIEEQKRFIEIIKGHAYEDLFTIQMFSGLRCGELLALTPDDIDLDNNVIHIRRTVSKDKKGKTIIVNTVKTELSERDIPITDLFKCNLLHALNNMQANEHNLIFHSKMLKINTISNINSYMVRLAKKNDFKDGNISTHILRHTYATRCIESGMPAEVLQKLLGHKNITTTINTYTTIFDKFKKEIVDTTSKNIALNLNL